MSTNLSPVSLNSDEKLLKNYSVILRATVVLGGLTLIGRAMAANPAIDFRASEVLAPFPGSYLIRWYDEEQLKAMPKKIESTHAYMEAEAGVK